MEPASSLLYLALLPVYDLWLFPTLKKADILFLSQNFQLNHSFYVHKRYCEFSYNIGLSKT